MYRRKLRIFIAALVFCTLTGVGVAQAMHAFSQSYVRQSQVVDNAKILRGSLPKDMMELADDTEFATGVQMILVTVPAMPQGWKPEFYAEYAAKEFGFGLSSSVAADGTVLQAKPGVLMLVSKAEEKVGFSMSTGLSLYLNNKVLNSIMANEITPHLKEHDLQLAARKGFEGLSDAVQGKYKTAAEKRKQYLPFAILLPLVILMQVLFGDGNAARFFGGGAWKRW